MSGNRDNEVRGNQLSSGPRGCPPTQLFPNCIDVRTRLAHVLLHRIAVVKVISKFPAISNLPVSRPKVVSSISCLFFSSLAMNVRIIGSRIDAFEPKEWNESRKTVRKWQVNKFRTPSMSFSRIYLIDDHSQYFPVKRYLQLILKWQCVKCG